MNKPMTCTERRDAAHAIAANAAAAYYPTDAEYRTVYRAALKAALVSLRPVAP